MSGGEETPHEAASGPAAPDSLPFGTSDVALLQKAQMRWNALSPEEQMAVARHRFLEDAGGPEQFEIMISRDLQELRNASEFSTGELQWLRERYILLQGQLTVMENHLKSILVIVSGIGRAALPQEALKVAEKDAKDLLAEAEKRAKEEEDRLIEARGGDHPPTEEEIAAAHAENLR